VSEVPEPNDINRLTTELAPAKESVEYHVHRLESAFYNKTAYMGYPTPEIEAQWGALTQCEQLLCFVLDLLQY